MTGGKADTEESAFERAECEAVDSFGCPHGSLASAQVAMVEKVTCMSEDEKKVFEGAECELVESPWSHTHNSIRQQSLRSGQANDQCPFSRIFSSRRIDKEHARK